MRDLEMRDALKNFVEYVEEQNLLLAEMVVRFGDPFVADPDFKEIMGKHGVIEFVRMYETKCREVREKWNLPR